MKKLLTTLLILTTAWTASAQEIVETDAVSEYHPEKIFAKLEAKAALWNELTAEQVEGSGLADIVVQLDEQDKALLDCPDCFSAEPGPSLAGIHLPVDIAVRFDETRSFGLVKGDAPRIGHQASKADGGFVWTTSVRAEEASGLRIKFTNVELPDGAALYIYSDAGEAHGPYTGRGPHDSGEFWSHSVLGQDVWVQLHVDGEANLAKVAFDIARVSYLGNAVANEHLIHWDDPAKADCSANSYCVENAECWSSLDSILNSARRAVAKISFENDADGLSYNCSGGLLNDSDSSDRIAWFLTANHCINSESEADSLEAKFQYQSSCGSCSGSAIDTVLGADHWASGSNGDFSLLELSELPSGWALQGWTTAKVLDDDGDQLYRISHPKGQPQAFSQHEIHDKTNDSGFGYNTDYYIYTKNVIGTTQGGSSGAPVFNANRKVVGQTKGKVGINSDSYTEGEPETCDPWRFYTQDGALSYYWKSVKAYLGSPTGTHKMHVNAVTPELISIPFPFGNITFYQALALVQIVDELGNGIPHATVKVSSSGDFTGTFQRVTDENGNMLVFVGAGALSNPPSYTVCVTSVTHDHFNTYDSGSNVETCDSN